MTIVTPQGQPVGPDGKPLDPTALLRGAVAALELARARDQAQQQLIQALTKALHDLLCHGLVAALPSETPVVAAAWALLQQIEAARNSAKLAEARGAHQLGKAGPEVQP